MPIPLKLEDRGKMLTDGFAGHIRERVQKLGHFFGGIRGCKVLVDGPGQHPLKGRIRIRIYLSLPGREIAVDRQTGADLAIAIRESFDAADQRLEDYVRRGRDAARERANRRA
ncbi:MAG TPA: HPF/RaiA family ribosome-associated protein [Planctomycetota bacterium]|jgi:hypothetical protein|nr:HPF/RaiA family ribosome-associated protein [Planctomycetota bacterium]